MIARQRGRRGFKQASAFAGKTFQDASEARGFAVSRLLTDWREIAGPNLADQARPVKVSYGRNGLGATLVVLVDGATAPLVQMQAEALKERVNACYGYRAISRIRVTQTAPTGFAEDQTRFVHKPPRPAATRPSPEIERRAAAEAEAVRDDGLRRALETLGANILSRTKS